MIDHLSVGKTAYFYARKRRLSNKAIDDLFRQLRSRSVSPSQNLFRHDREEFDGARWSAISFFHERNPAFLSVPPATKERVCGYLFIVEYSEYVAVFRAGLEVPSAFKTRHLQRVATTRVEAAIAHADAIFEKIRLRNMSPSRLVLRSKTLEATDLQNTTGMSGASRFAPQSYSVRRGDGQHSATPTTGRISHRSERSDYQELIQWACAVIDELAQPPGEVAPFIRNFARPIDLASVASTLRPASFAVNVASLSEAIFENPDVRLVQESEEGFVELGENQAADVMDRLDVIFFVSKWRGHLRIVTRVDREAVGNIDVGENRISMRRLDLPDVGFTYVESVGWPLGESPDRTPLRRYIDRGDHFIVLFQDPTLAYIDGSLYRDELLADGGGNFLRHIHAEPALADASSEKGAFSADQTVFDDDSVFGVIANSIAEEDEFLICDDLGDEWADFIGLNVQTNPAAINFYHAKHGALSLGASPFHVAVSQAIKNLGRMMLPADAMHGKVNSWGNLYVSGGGQQTAISRIIRGDGIALPGEIENLRTAPDVIRKVVIVTSSLSRHGVAETFQAIRNGMPPSPHFVQLYWLLQAFFSACYEVGAFGYIICQE